MPAAPNGKPAWPREWVNVWLPLETWSKFNQLEKPIQYGSGGDASFVVQTTNGTFRFKVGSHTLEHAGHGFLLGFAPRLIKGFLYVHAIDACKTLQPLLSQPWQLTKANRTIVIDPGHGGRDGGTQSCLDGQYEKIYALDWARRLAVLLSECGWNVVLTRTNDSYLSLADRIAIADRAQADVFVSLHFNSGNGNSSLSGIETYCLTPAGMPSSILRGEDDPRDVHPNNAYDEQNFQLATALHRSALQATGATDRGVGRARFMGVLRGQARPAVLVEGGYLTNPREAQKIATPEYRQALAEALAKALQ
jgi:N-acetylmuramoyl-L-alanine amidase